MSARTLAGLALVAALLALGFAAIAWAQVRALAEREAMGSQIGREHVDAEVKRLDSRIDDLQRPAPQ